MSTTSDAPVPPPVLFRTENTVSGHRIGVATLNRPRQLNALNLEMCRLLLTQLGAWRADPAIACVLLEGAGDKGFCAGGDVAEVVRHLRGLTGATGEQRFAYGDDFFATEYRLDLLIHQFAKPLVAVSHGVCMGGGLGLAAGASHRVFVDGSKIAMPEIHIGLFPDVGGGYFLNRMPPGIGALLALTGYVIGAADARFVGLADGVIDEAARATLAARLCASAWTGGAARDRALLDAVLPTLASPTVATGPLAAHAETLRALADCASVGAFRERLELLAASEPLWAPAARNLAQGSPTAAHVTFEYLRRCRGLDVAAVLALDGVLARQFQRHHDFSEGVRALLIDKDRAPQWSPRDWAEVTPALVAGHFEPV